MSHEEGIRVRTPYIHEVGGGVGGEVGGGEPARKRVRASWTKVDKERILDFDKVNRNRVELHAFCVANGLDTPPEHCVSVWRHQEDTIRRKASEEREKMRVKEEKKGIKEDKLRQMALRDAEKYKKMTQGGSPPDDVQLPVGSCPPTLQPNLV